MKVIKNKKAMKGPGEWFSGDVNVEFLFVPIEPGAASGAMVTFKPGARTAWHKHPIGQTLIITSGEGWVQAEGEDKQDIKKGDVVQFAPGERHWHGATDTSGMSHIAIQEAKDGKTADWMEHVEDEDYKNK